MIQISELQGSEYDPKFFNESWGILILTIGIICWTKSLSPPNHDMLTRIRMMMMVIVIKEIVQ
jgi:hypothetical protein